MRVQRHLTISIPIPPSLPPAVVLAALHTIEPVIRHLGILSRYESIPTRPGVAAGDAFFAPDDPIVTYNIYERITLAPGLTKEISHPSYFQLTASGVRGRADAPAGITAWADFSVRAIRDPGSPEGSASTPSTVAADEEYALQEVLVVEGNSLLMPFVSQTMQDSHRDICSKVVEEIVHKYATGFDYFNSP
ncbi:hypothetical protein S7711_08099 [Stachybotrys chartarum IBT 7711]|uniref:DUF7053 domain-containing protein n=1 Tax=Stachybotrys chartarum (strain CBS 109288 / IBT 7711) TaxID=1280523 RepID=A0A084B254_STACB|nr:hypothetical protein S7711_08099 [Stachybotrys chartarum IBT 7711]KFA51800.1 hypothetical protein S40293_05887 [Stachybotrys chartarum IBT 40293]KFA79665.1 hypothetical protein S40288_04089 [Stachybotrys chartarum IBT 40288]